MNLLITGAWINAKDHFKELEALGHAIAFLPQEQDELPCAPDWVEGVICNWLFRYHPIGQFANLRFIQLITAGYDRIDMDYVRSHNIEIHNVKDVYSIPMAEYAISGVLQLYRQAGFFHENQKACRWEKHRGLLELWGKTVTIVGCGYAGTECAKRFRAFCCKVIGLNRTVRENEAFDEVLPMDKLDEMLPRTDILLLTVALDRETVRLVDRRRLELLPSTAVVVNISRGPILDAAALREMLADGRLAGAVLDVFENEPLPASDPLWNTPNLVLTPHNSFVGEGNAERMFTLFERNLREIGE